MLRKLSACSVAVAALAAGLVAAPSASAAPDRATRAEQAARTHPNQVALDDSDALIVRDQFTDADGTAHVRFDRTRSGLPVLGGDLVVHQAPDGALRGVSATTRRPLRLSLTSSVTKEEAIATARAAADNGATGVASAVLEIDAREEGPRLVWAVVVLGQQEDQTPSELLTLVDAQSRRIVDTQEQVETADTGTGNSLWSGQVRISTTQVAGGFTLTDADRGAGLQRTTDLNGATTGSGAAFTDADDVWGSGDLTSRQSAAVDAHYGAAKTWDFYQSTYGRSGIANDGKGALSRVHYGTDYDNAFWQDSCFCMTYGDGAKGAGYDDGPLVSLDVAGHEMSHGVTSRTARLNYSGESGGLNEATSDIFGTMVEFYAANAADVGDYDIGEQFTHGQPFRFMWNPIKDGSSPNCYSKSLGRLNVHYSSGVANRFFYLLSEGSTSTRYTGGLTVPTCNAAPAVVGITQAKAGAIWYRALTTYLTSRSKYADARLATLNAAASLYGGSGSPEYAAVNAAWRAVGVV